MPAKLIDLTGQTFGSWTVLDRADGQRWSCVCVCGEIRDVFGPHLRGGITKSCGCSRKKALLTYEVAHRKVMRARGKAKYWPCVDCDAPASDWSYDHSDPDELTEERFVNGVLAQVKTYSANPDHYSPKCRKCNTADQYTKGARS